MSSRRWYSWTSLQLRALSPPGLVQGWMLAQDAFVVEFSESQWGGVALNYVSAVGTIPVLHRLSRDSYSVPYSPTQQGYSPTKSTVVTPLQFSQSAFSNHYCCHRGECLSKSHFIRHQCSWHISIPNPPLHDEPDRQNLVRQKLRSGQTWNSIPLAWNMVIYWLTNRMGIQHPDRLLETVVFKFIVDCVENSI